RRLDLTTALDQWRDNERDERELRWRTQDLDTRERALDDRERSLAHDEDDLPRRRRKATDEGRAEGRAERAAEHDAWVAKLNHQTSDAEDREKSADGAIQAALDHQRRLEDENQQAIAAAVRRAQDANLTAYLRQHHPDILDAFTRQQATAHKPTKPRLELQTRLPDTADRRGVELIVVHDGTTTPDDTVWLDVQIRESDPRARGQKGLHIAMARGTSGRQVPFDIYSWTQLRTIQDAAGDNKLVSERGGEVLGVRADLMPSATNRGLRVNPPTARQGQPLTPDVLTRQQAHEDRQRDQQPRPRPGDFTVAHPTAHDDLELE
ncbi:MAG: hypothetical protein ACRDS9_29110, partial [Pseudonocardiaceae bacterium]